ncbi:MAG: hypothetical protein LBG61_04925 [Burkholderiales bacterium]|jgi:hypothetical protein|nr:hypothetical protein [Burkholderiales bacterium]
MELTREQIKRQDFVDGAIFELLQTINPTHDEIKWDIEIIGNIRDTIQSFYKFNEQAFYPFLEE